MRRNTTEPNITLKRWNDTLKYKICGNVTVNSSCFTVFMFLAQTFITGLNLNQIFSQPRSVATNK